MHPTVTVLCLLFQFEFLLFFSFLVAVSKTFKTMLNKNDDNRHTCLVLNLGMLSGFHD